MTDTEIIKALNEFDTDEIRMRYCIDDNVKHILTISLTDIKHLINRQQADNDRLTEENNRLKSLILEFMDCVLKWSAKHDNDLSDEINKIPVMDKYRGKVKEIKYEARKEFAERLKEEMRKYCGDITEDDINNLLKEMGCDNA